MDLFEGTVGSRPSSSNCSAIQASAPARHSGSPSRTRPSVGQASFSRTIWLTAEPSALPDDARHHVGHHATDVAQRRGADLGDHVVDDLVELVVGERVGHELLEHLELEVFLVRLLLAAGGLEGLERLDALLALALQHLQLLVLRERTLQLLLRRAEAREDQDERVATVVLACEARLLELVFDRADEFHSHSLPGIEPQWNPGSAFPANTCQCRWNTVCPARGPTLTITR